MKFKPNLTGKKTIGVALLNAAFLRFIPGAQEFVKEDPVLYGELLSITMIGLRLVTKEAVKWKKSH